MINALNPKSQRYTLFKYRLSLQIEFQKGEKQRSKREIREVCFDLTSCGM